MEYPALYAIVNLESQLDPVGFTERLLEAGVKLLQLRTKILRREDFSRIAREAIAVRDRLSDGFSSDRLARIIINDDALLAKEVMADGVHLGQDDLEPEKARAILGEAAIIGYSTHNLEQVRAAALWPIDYLGFGPVFASSTKTGHAAVVGTTLLRQAVKASTFPVVGIGGITTENVREVYEAGASSAAVIAALESAPDVSALVKRFEEIRSTETARAGYEYHSRTALARK